MSLDDLYKMIYPEMEKVLPKTTSLTGQVFLRDAGDGLIMAVAIFSGDPSKVPVEMLYPVRVEIEHEKGEDISEQTIGEGLSSVLRLPVWRVQRKFEETGS